MRILFTATAMAACLILSAGCEGDYEAQPGDPQIEVRDTPDLDPGTDDDVDVRPPDIDVDVEQRPGTTVPDVDVDAFQTPDKDTKANQP